MGGYRGSPQGVRIKYGRGGTKNLGKIYPVYLAIPPKKMAWDFAIPPFRMGEIS